jgi:hypothetical protein
MWKFYEIQISVSINKALWNTAMLICIYTICGCFGAITEELNSCSRDCTTHKTHEICHLATLLILV